MLALRSAPPVVGPAEAERIALEVYGLAAVCRPLPGERDCNFQLRAADAREYVLRIVDPAADPPRTECLARALRHLAEQDPAVPVPKICATLDGADLGEFERAGTAHATLLTEYLPGRLLAELPVTPQLLLEVGRSLGRLDRALRGFFHPALAQPIAWDVRRLPELMEFVRFVAAPTARRRIEAVGRALIDRLPLLRGLTSQALHGDCHPGNILIDPVTGAVSGILDFGDMIHAPLILEPAVAMSEILTADAALPRDLAPLLDGYARVESLDAADLDVLFDLVTARHAVTVLLHAWRQHHGDPGERLLKTAAVNAASSLERLLDAARGPLTREWQLAAGAPGPGVATNTVAAQLSRRHRLLGSGAELFYEKPLHLVRGDGVWLYDAKGRAYLDAYNNVPHVGHCHPHVVRAVARQFGTLVTHTRYLHERILDYAEALTARCPAHLDACLFVNSGSEANDIAWRMAQFATGSHGALVMAHAYHGITDAVAALNAVVGHADARVATIAAPPAGLSADDALDAAVLAATVEDVDVAVATLASRGSAPAAFFIDSALTSSGIFDPPPAWLAAVAARVRAAGGLIVADEVQYGLGRSGSHFWGFERRGVSPDIVTLGKPVGNGYPIGVVIATRAMIEAFQAKYGFFSTFGGSPVAAAAGLAVLKVLDREKLMDNARATGDYLRQKLEEVAAQYACLGRVRGAGLLLGLEVRGPDANAPIKAGRLRTKKIVNALASRGRVLIGSEGPLANILKLRPPMPFAREHADLLVQAVEAAAAAIDSP